MQYAYAICIFLPFTVRSSFLRRPMTPPREAAAAIPLKPVHHLILLLLAEEPSYGVELMDRLEARSEGAIRLNPGSLYRTIGKLVDDGLAEPLEEVPGGEGVGAPRKIYGVTPRGLAALRAEARRQASLLEAARALDLLEEGT